ncbi:MAG TPA: 50S ribosomal protein L32 [Bdellovibrionales bacterium]|nr:50S ribosomal protein L32 [Pseudobdellovibrionaceae bacterium]HAG91360.1 50S ribosomal protein L32 [Bdellovibrionales bacterium]
MPTPKKKTTRSKRDMRRAHDFLTAPGVHNCPNCGALARPHHVCGSCGYYKNKEVVAAQA